MAVITANGVEMYYEDAGIGDPIVLVHGLGSYSGDWRPQIDALSRRYRVIALDLRGHGRSEKPPGPYSIAAFAADVASLIRSVHAAPAHVVGLSLGGAVAFQLAVDEPALVRSLTIVSSGPTFNGSSLRLRLMIVMRLFLLKTFGLPTLGRTIVKRLFPLPDQAPLRQAFLAHFVTNDPRAYEASTRALVGWSVADRLATIACPVLVISGDRDYTTVDAKRPYVAALPNARLVVIENGGHACTLDQPAAVNRALAEFLASVTARTAAPAPL